MVDETRSDSSVSGTHFAPLGEVLLAARKAKKLTQNDISNSLRISVKQIDAIENNAFELLPESATTRGFIRNYARFLGVEVEPLLASHRQRIPSNEPASLSVKTSTRHVMKRETHQAWLKYLLGGLLLIILLGGLYAMNLIPALTRPSSVSLDTSISEPLPEAALPAAERHAAVEVATETSALPESMPSTEEQSATQVTQSSLTAQAGVSSTLAADAAPVANNTTTPNATEQNATATHKISMTFSEPTWVRAKNKAGKVIFEKTFSAGDTGGFDDEPPISILIGNANATKLQYLGQPVDLTASTKGNVARVKLP